MVLRIWLVCLLGGLWVSQSLAQELTPRLFWPSPKSTKVLVTGYAYTRGDVLFDQSVPIEGADSSFNTGILAYAQTLGLWGRTSNVLIELPYAWGTTQGQLEGEYARRDFSAGGDLGLSLNVNLRGAPSMSVQDFQAFRASPKPLIGASLKVLAPTGHYNPDRLVNVGANRWAARFKLGTTLLLKPKLLLDLSASAWWFGDNDDFVQGKKEQEPIYAVEANLIKRIRPGLWASLDVTYYRGGRQTIAGEPLRDWQRNVKLGGTLVFPFGGSHAIKMGYARGVITRYGNDFNQFLMSYQLLLQ
jgi:hypothetical protein